MRAYILPHPPIAVWEVGGEEIEKIAATEESFDIVSEDIYRYDPETIIIISPHAPLLADAFYISKGHVCVGNLARFGAPEPAVSYEYDTELSDEIARLCKEGGIPVFYSDHEASVLDHGCFVPLYFINRKYGSSIKKGPFRIVRIAPSMLSDEILFKMGSLIERATAHMGRRAVIIASGDLSHKLKKEGPYGYIKEGPMFDKAVTDVMKSGKLADFAKIDKKVNELSANCGYQGFVMLAGALSGYKVTPDFLSYEGTFGVGYGICIFECQDWYVKLAKQSLEKYVTSGQPLTREETAEYPDRIRKNRAGVFVCIKKWGELRGCIGTILPTRDNALEETAALAISAGTEDPRFSPVSSDELDELEYTVDLMGRPQSATEDMLDVKKYGVIVTCGNRRGLLLPDLEGVDTVEEQLAISCRKGGIAPWEDYTIERFSVERHV